MRTKILSLVLFLVLLISGLNLSSEPRKVVVEFSTGTWCGGCPCGDAACEQILTTYPQTIVIAYHGSSTDPWQNFTGSEIRSMLGFSAYPTGIFDRTNHPGNNGAPYPYITYDLFYSKVQTRYNTFPDSRINIAITNSSYNVGTRLLSVSLNTTALQNLSGQYKIVYVLTEDNVVYPQTFTADCGTAGVHNDYIHKWIARYVVNTANGENLNTGTWAQNQVIPKTVSATIDNAWIAQNGNLNIIVYKDSTSGLFISAVEQGKILPLAGLIGITGNNGIVPSAYSLSQNYPNPFNPVTNIKFTVPKDGNVSLKIYDVVGNLVAIYFDGIMKAGSYNADFDGTNLASGIYFYTLRAGSFSETKKMSLIK